MKYKQQLCLWLCCLYFICCDLICDLMVQWSVRNRPDGAVLCQEHAWWCSVLSGTCLMVQHSRLPMVLNKLAKPWDNFIQSVNLCWRRSWWQQPPVTHCSQFQADNHIQQWVNSEGLNRGFITSASFCCVLSISLLSVCLTLTLTHRDTHCGWLTLNTQSSDGSDLVWYTYTSHSIWELKHTMHRPLLIHRMHMPLLKHTMHTDNVQATLKTHNPQAILKIHNPCHS